MYRFLRLFAVFLFCLLSSFNVTAALAQTTTDAPKEAEKPAPVDTFGRTTPRGAVEGYLKAIRAEDYEKAAVFMDVSNEESSDKRRLRQARSKELMELLNRDGYFLDFSELSDDPKGRLDDQLKEDQEKVGVLDHSVRKVPIILQRQKAENGADVWLFSAETLLRVPFLLRVSKEGWLDRSLPGHFKDLKFANVSIGHWMAIAAAALGSLMLGLLISRILIYLLRHVSSKRVGLVAWSALGVLWIPLGLLIGVQIYRLIILNLGVQVIAREMVEWMTSILGWVSVVWLVSRIIDGVADVVRRNMPTNTRLTSLAMVMLAKRLAKAVVYAFAGITILRILGVDVTSGLAALGIGGLALALGAQKTIENLVGSVTVVADKPVRVGDFCKFGDISGTVEDIGIRSTQVRTLSRTLVTVPNGAFASMQIENYTLRDKFKMETVLNLRYETTPDQIRYVLTEIRKLLFSYDVVDNAPARARLVGLGNHSLDISVFVYLYASTYEDYLAVQEDILLRIMDVVKASGTDFAFPSQTIYMAQDPGVAETVSKKIGKEMQKRIKDGEVDLPHFREDKIAELDGSIKFGN